MKPSRALALFAAVAVISVAGGAAYHLWLRGDGPGPATAERIYALRLADLKGTPQVLEQWRGKVVVVNFWATWCAPCREEIPGFVKLQERYGVRGLVFVGIAIDQPGKVAEFAGEFRINYPVLVAGADILPLLREAGNPAGVLPYTLVIDRRGTIVSRQPGGLKEDRLEGLLQPLL